MTSNLKDFVEYVDDILAADIKDTNAFSHAAQMFFEFQKKSDIINGDLVQLSDSILAEVTDDDKMPVFLTALQLGLILGKYSKKIEIANVTL